jgi:hypothetical protein
MTFRSAASYAEARRSFRAVRCEPEAFTVYLHTKASTVAGEAPTIDVAVFHLGHPRAMLVILAGELTASKPMQARRCSLKRKPCQNGKREDPAQAPG